MSTKFKMLIQIAATILVSLLLATGLGYLNRWRIVFFSLYSIIAVAISLVLAVIAFLTKRSSAAKNSRTSKILFLLSLFCGLQFFASDIADKFHSLEVQYAIEFIESLIPRLADYHNEHSDYPESIYSIIVQDENIPALLQLLENNPYTGDKNKNFYRRIDSTSYKFEFWAPNGWIGYDYTFCCGVNGKWIIQD